MPVLRYRTPFIRKLVVKKNCGAGPHKYLSAVFGFYYPVRPDARAVAGKTDFKPVQLSLLRGSRSLIGGVFRTVQKTFSRNDRKSLRLLRKECFSQLFRGLLSVRQNFRSVQYLRRSHFRVTTPRHRQKLANKVSALITFDEFLHFNYNSLGHSSGFPGSMLTFSTASFAAIRP